MAHLPDFRALLLYVLFLAYNVQAVPSPASIGSDIEILLHNDVYGNLSSRNAAVLVLRSPKTKSEAAQACAALGESLWTPPDLTDDVFLPYLAYEAETKPSGSPPWPNREPDWGHGPGSSQLFFIAGTGRHGSCKAITPSDQIIDVGCDRQLPALCTQSAPLSSMDYADTKPKFQTDVSSGNAVYTGYRDKLSFRFLGIRYAAEPQRFTYSSLYSATGQQSALEFGNYCVQYSGGSTDCLFLNVWTPYLPSSNDQKPRLRPVMMWIHGGAYVNGMGSDPTFDGGNLASRGDVVVVTINYRLGTLGFLALNSTGINGNYGIGDQITALRWIQENIKNFGGDPDHVTILGQSAGAGSVRALLQSPPATGLFAGAVLQSNPQGPLAGGPLYTTYLTVSQEIAEQTNEILTLTGCANPSTAAELACLRAYNASELAHLSTVANNVIVDGIIVITDRLEFNGTGHVNSVPLLMGNMRDDGAPFFTYVDTTSFATSLTDSGFPASLVINSDDFPVPAGPNTTLDGYNATARVSTDGQMRCGDLATAYAVAVTKTLPVVYYYEFNRSYQITYWDPNGPVCDAPVTPGYPHGDPNAEYFKCHSGELMYVFGTWMRWGLPIRDDADVPFTQFVIDSWAAFVRTFDPVPDIGYLRARGFVNTTREIEGAGGGRWEPVGAGTGQQTLRQMQWPSFQAPFGEAAQCEALGFPLDYFLK